MKCVNGYFDETLDYWKKLWQKQLGIKTPVFTGIAPFVANSGYRPLIMPRHEFITEQWLFDACRERFDCWKYTNWSLDRVVVKNDRDPRNGAYVAWFRDRVEADEELRSVSAVQLEKDGISGITLLEREVMEYDYFNRTNGHLDINNMTLCSGSRYLCDDLPRVRCDGEKFFIHYFFADRGEVAMRSRQFFIF